MQEYFDEMEYIIGDSYSLSEPTIKNDLLPTTGDLNIEENVKDYPIRCPNCYNIPRIYFDMNSNDCCLMCDEGHKASFMSFKDLLENSSKKLSSILCHDCKKESNEMYKRNEDNLFFCSECKNKYNKNNFTEIKEIDTTCPKHHKKYKYYDTTDYKNICDECYQERKENYLKSNNLIETEKYVKYKETIEKYHNKAIENIKMWNNTSKIINNWLKKLNDTFQDFLSSISNYCLLQQKLVNYMKTENSYLKYNNNFNIYSNYEAINDDKADSFIRMINEYLNVKYNKSFDIYTMSTFFINILTEYKKKDLKIESKINIKPKEEGKEDFDENKVNKEIKLIKDMAKKTFELDSKINCLIPFEQGDYLMLGFNTGEISICEVIDNNLAQKIKIKEFKKEIAHLCEIDKYLFVASDIDKNTKIIQIENDFRKYKVIKKLDLGEYNKIYKIVRLPIISYFKNFHYFAIAADKYILIYNSNKMPHYLEPPYLQYHDNVEEFSIVQPTDNNKEVGLNFKLYRRKTLNSNVENILEINDRYLAVICTDSKILKLFNTQNEFNEEKNLPYLVPNNDSFMKLTKKRKELIIGYDGGFNIIDLNNLNKMRSIKMNQNVKSIEFMDSNCMMCLCFVKGEIYIKQYKVKNQLKEMKKLSETIVLTENKITNFVVIKNKIYYIDETNLIHYYE